MSRHVQGHAASLVWSSASVSEVGPRARNEDCAVREPDLGLFAVCDGMGGHVAGELASRAVARALVQHMRDERSSLAEVARGERPASEVSAMLGAGVLRGAAVLDALVALRPALHGLGTTCTAVVLVGARGYVAHLGDSRLHLLRDGRLRVITRDHTFVAEAVRAGLLSEEEARTSSHRNLLTRAVGAGDPMPELDALDLCAGDRLLLSSDGVHGPLSADAIGELLGAHAEPSVAAGALVHAAFAAGGHDNATAVVIDVASARADAIAAPRAQPRDSGV